MTSILPVAPQRRIELVKTYANLHAADSGHWTLMWEMIKNGNIPDAEIVLVTKSANTERGVLVLMSRQLKSLTSSQLDAVLAGKRTLLTITPPVQADAPKSHPDMVDDSDYYGEMVMLLDEMADKYTNDREPQERE